MKITAGLGSVDEYPEYVEAGADELFAGYVPDRWRTMGGELAPLNRREVSFVPVQLGARSEMEILAAMIKELGVPVTITLNSLFYLPQQYPLLYRIIEECLELGFDSFILADPAAVMQWRDQMQGTEAALYLSGEFGELNRGVLSVARRWGSKRVIFHRKTSLREMRDMIRRERELYPEAPMEYEAFAMNEMCHYHGGFCHTVHCDALAPMCHVPWRLNGREQELDKSASVPGAGGCALCALWEMQRIGITHLKLVSRGNYCEDTVRDIRTLRRALELLEEASSEKEYLHRMRAVLFPDGCSENCYYPQQ